MHSSLKSCISQDQISKPSKIGDLLLYLQPSTTLPIPMLAHTLHCTNTRAGLHSRKTLSLWAFAQTIPSTWNALAFHCHLSKLYSSIEAHLSLHILCEIIISPNMHWPPATCQTLYYLFYPSWQFWEIGAIMMRKLRDGKLPKSTQLGNGEARNQARGHSKFPYSFALCVFEFTCLKR